jgi:folate-binding protein YgfZ
MTNPWPTRTITLSVPSTGEIGDRPVVLDYGDVAAEYSALRTGALLVDQSHRDRWTLTGARAAEMLAGLVTNDVQSLTPGHGQYAAALTPKGKIVADMRVLALDEGSLLVDVPTRAAAGWSTVLRKYVNPRVVAYRDVTPTLRAMGLYGVRSRDALADACGLHPTALALLTPYAHVAAIVDGAEVRVARMPDLGVDGFELFVPAEHFDAVWKRLAAAAAVTRGGSLAYDIARVEAGRPEWGVDIDDNTIPQEANFDELHAISYTKGCYTGQEVVARVHFRGHVNRHLRGILFDEAAMLPPRAALFDTTGKAVGDVRTALVSPRLGGIGLAMVRREVPIGTTLVARPAAAPATDGGGAPPADDASSPPVEERLVTVGPLPFAL